MACESSKKGKISFIDRGTTKEIIVPIAPFFVSCNPTGSCGNIGIRTITYNVANPAASANNGSTYSFNSFKDETALFKAVSQPGAYDGNHYDLWGNCPNGERLIEASFSVNSGAVSIISNVFKADGSTGLVVKDANGNILFNIAVSECNYQLSCDDDCPKGFCKCHSDSYPGYCCLDCGSIGASIHGITNELRAKNG